MKLTRETGISLLETLVAMFLTGVVSMAVFKIYCAQHQNWTIQDGMVDMQQNGRAVIDELTRYIRMAGNAVPDGVDAIEASNTDPDTIAVTFAINDSRADLDADMASPDANLHCGASDLSRFRANQWVYIFDPDSSYGEYFEISEINYGSSEIVHSGSVLSRNYKSGAVVLPLQRIKYFVDKSDALHPNLMIQLQGQPAVVYAEYVEDLQLQYKMKNGMIMDVPSVSAHTREVLITLRARTSVPDPSVSGDQYRHCCYASRVNLRNLNG